MTSWFPLRGCPMCFHDFWKLLRIFFFNATEWVFPSLTKCMRESVYNSCQNFTNSQYSISGLCHLRGSVSPEINTRTTQDISAPDQSWGGCDNPTTNWPYQGHKILYLVQRTTNCLPALWPDSDNWVCTPWMYSVATKSWWVLHSWLIEDPLWDDPGSLHNIISERSWIL